MFRFFQSSSASIAILKINSLLHHLNYVRRIQEPKDQNGNPMEPCGGGYRIMHCSLVLTYGNQSKVSNDQSCLNIYIKFLKSHTS